MALSLVLGSVPALAAPAEEGETEEPVGTEDKAMTVFAEGQAAYDRGEYSEALQYFLEAQSLYPSPVFHYNIGRCYEALENYDQAIISYKAYLRSYKSATGSDPDDKINIENTITRLEKLAEAEKAERDKPDDDPPPVVTPIEDEPERKPGRAMVITGSVLTVVGLGVAVGGGAAFGSQASSISKDLEQVYEQGNPDRLTLADARELDEQGRAAERNQIILVSIGSAVALTGVALLVVGVVQAKKGKQEAKPSARVFPALGGGAAGLVVQGRF